VSGTVQPADDVAAGFDAKVVAAAGATASNSFGIQGTRVGNLMSGTRAEFATKFRYMSSGTKL